jgi:muramoyltetrapeptide carboxypeptidase
LHPPVSPRSPKRSTAPLPLLVALGHRVVIDPNVHDAPATLRRTGQRRLAAVMRMAADPDVDLAITVRGGYGWSRLIDGLDSRQSPQRASAGWDTAISPLSRLAALAHAGLTTFAGPMAAFDFGAETPSAYTLEHCWALLDNDRCEIECALDGPDVATEGTLWGATWRWVAHLVGTPHLPQIDGGILFLEDVGESP